MAPVAATSTGVARQTIDDPRLVELISRLSVFDVRLPRDDDAAAAAADMMVVDDALGEEGGGTNAVTPKPPSPPPDVDGLVAELDRVPRWQFQEQVSWPLAICIIHQVDACDDQCHWY
jgi:hypothetical protein